MSASDEDLIRLGVRTIGYRVRLMPVEKEKLITHGLGNSCVRQKKYEH